MDKDQLTVQLRYGHDYLKFVGVMLNLSLASAVKVVLTVFALRSLRDILHMLATRFGN